MIVEMDLKIGDWITQYSSGYWQIIDIKPKFADETRNNEYANYNKGDLIGSWVIAKKGFTDKMKFRTDFDWLDSALCKKLPDEKEEQIKKYFAENPKHFEKFENAEVKLCPAVSTIWLQLNEEQVETVKNIIDRMPKLFTASFFTEELKKQGLSECVHHSPGNYCINFFSYLWDMDENFDVLYHRAVLNSFDDPTK